MPENNRYLDSRFEDDFSSMRSGKLLKSNDKVITLCKKFANFLSNNILHSNNLSKKHYLLFKGIIKVKLDTNYDSLNYNKVKDCLSQENLKWN